MGSLLNIVANHQLRFNSGTEGIKLFEAAVNQKINHWNFKRDEPLVKNKKDKTAASLCYSSR